MSENSLGIFPAGLKTCPSVSSRHLQTYFFPVLFFGFRTKKKWEAGLIHESQTCFFLESYLAAQTKAMISLENKQIRIRIRTRRNLYFQMLDTVFR